MRVCEKNSAKLRAGLIAVIVIGIIGIGVFAFTGKGKAKFDKLKGTPEEIVVAAMNNTNVKVRDEEIEMKTKTGKMQVGHLLEKANEMNFDLILQGVSGIESAKIISTYIKDIGVSGNIQSTKDLRKLNGNLNLTQSGMELLGMSVYKDTDEIGVSIPKILDAPYAIKTDSWLEDYKNSALYKLEGGKLIKEEFNRITEEFSALEKYLKGTMNFAENKEFVNQIQDIQAQLIKAAQVVENGKEKVILTDGSEIECNVYTGSLTNKEILDFLNQEIEVLISLDFIRNYIDIAQKQSGTTIDGLIEEMRATLEDDVALNIDIDFLVDDTYLRGIRMASNQQGSQTYSLIVQYTGINYLLDGIKVNFIVGANDKEERLGVVFNQNLGEEADVYNQDFSLFISGENIEEFGLDYHYIYNTKAKEDNLKIDFSINEDNKPIMSYTAIGTKKVGAGEVFTNLSKASLMIDDIASQIILDFSLGYGIKAIKESDMIIEKTGGKYLFDMTESELLSTIQSIKSNIQSFTYGLI